MHIRATGRFVGPVVKLSTARGTYYVEWVKTVDGEPFGTAKLRSFVNYNT